MLLLEDIKLVTKPFENAVITIGNFDGVHIGHQSLFHAVIEKADAIGGTSIAMTFEPHPIRVLKQNGHPPLITLHEQKVELIERSGIDVLIVVPFDHAFAAITAEAFIQDLLVRAIGMKAIVVGRDYTFGRNREGTVDLLQAFAGELDYEVIVADWIQNLNGLSGRISSTRIRELVMEGRMVDAQKLLGRHYQIRGLVEKGRDRGGKLLGFPTANIILHDELCPRSGVYAVSVECRGNLHKGVANIGYSPTFDDRKFTVEVHLLDFNDDIYGEQIRVNFIKRMRDEMRFENFQALADQIAADVRKAREILSF